MGTSDVHMALERVTRKLDELEIPYAVCGALAVNAHQHQRATTDVDLLLTPAGLAKFKLHALGLGWLEKFPGSRGVRDMERRVPIDFLVTGGFPGDGTPRGVVFPDPAEAAIDINGRKYLTLAKLVELKLASGLSAPDRLKDFADVIAPINWANTSPTPCTRMCNRSMASCGDTRRIRTTCPSEAPTTSVCVRGVHRQPAAFRAIAAPVRCRTAPMPAAMP